MTSIARSAIHAAARQILASSDSDIETALQAIRTITLSSHPGRTVELSPAAVSFLQATLTGSEYTLYRGLSMYRAKLDDAQRDQVNALQEGDPMPSFLQKHTFADPYTSFSSKRDVAYSYARNGDMEILVQAQVPKASLLADLAQLEQALKARDIEQQIITPDDFNYLNRDGEVIAMKPVQATVIHVKGQV